MFRGGTVGCDGVSLEGLERSDLEVVGVGRLACRCFGGSSGLCRETDSTFRSGPLPHPKLGFCIELFLLFLFNASGFWEGGSRLVAFPWY